MSVLKLIDGITRPKTARIVYVTEVEVLKKGGREGSKFAGLPVPSKLQGLNRIVTRVVNVAHDYTEAVENQLAKSIKKEYPVLTGGEAKNAAGQIWETSEHKWAEVDPAYLSGNVYRHREEHNKKYLKIFEDMSSKLCEGGMFKADTGEIVPVSWDEMVSFFKKDPSKSKSLKQEDAGLEKQIKFRLVAACNVKLLKCGEQEYNDLSPTEQELLDEILRKEPAN